MQVSRVLQLTWVLTLILTIVFLVVLFRVDPYEGGISALVAFMAILFLVLGGILTLPGYYLRVWTLKSREHNKFYLTALRQAILISIAIVGLLLLKAMDVLAWWDGLLLVGALVLLELFFRS